MTKIVLPLRLSSASLGTSPSSISLILSHPLLSASSRVTTEIAVDLESVEIGMMVRFSKRRGFPRTSEPIIPLSAEEASSLEAP
jgi:hypothetical protein